MSYSYDRRFKVADRITQQARALRRALEHNYRRKGFDAMMLAAYETEAGGRFTEFTQPRKLLIDVLNDLSRALPLTKEETFSLAGYRDDLRRGR